MTLRNATIGLCLLLLAGAAMQAQQPEAPLPEPPPAADQPADDAAQSPAEQFQAIFDELQQIGHSLQQLAERYPLADEQQRKEIEAEYVALAQRGQGLYPQLQPAAEKAFRDNPDKQQPYSQFLLSLVGEHTMSANYDEAQRVFSMLIENKYDDATVRTLGAMMAMASGDLVGAETHLELAAEHGETPPDAELMAEEVGIRQAEARADDLPRVELETSKGKIVVELFENEAPNTVANFISLVEKDFYDGLKFHRVVDGFVAQGGDPTGTGMGGPGYAIPCELGDDHRKHFIGSLSMAHAGKDTGGSQFFLTFAPTRHLDGMHTVFGRVIEGMDVLPKINRIQPRQEGVEADVIKKATVLRKRDHEYTPKTLPDPRKQPE